MSPSHPPSFSSSSSSLSTLHPHVVSIPPGEQFLPTLVEALLTGELIKGFCPKDDPFALATATLWVPTRRAARALADEFVLQMPNEAAFLPQIKALGDGDNDQEFFTQEAIKTPQLDATISPLERHLILSKLVNRWADSLKPDQRNLYQGADIIMPSSLSDAIWFAADLTQLMDMVTTEEADWQNLENLVHDDQAEWWQLTLEFLKIATRQWPLILQERGLQDSSLLRTRALRQQSKIYQSQQAEGAITGPVILAGSTGSIPATADLIKTIAQLDQGMVILPGLDRDLDEETWHKVDLPDNEHDDSGTAPTHPQYGLKKLLDHLGLVRDSDDIAHLTPSTPQSIGPMRVREQLVSEALRPSFSTGKWQKVFTNYNEQQKCEALHHVAFIEASGERQEALAIALALRETLEDETKTAALITPDRNLARRVAVEMRRFNIDVDDSAGQPLRNRPPGTLLRLILHVGFAQPSPIALISLLKHPYARFGATPQRARHSARLFELVLLRGAVVAPTSGHYLENALKMETAIQDKTMRIHPAIRRMSPQDWQDLKWLAETLDNIFTAPPTPLEQKSENQSEKQPLNQLIQQTITWLEAIAHDQDKGLSHLYGTEEGRHLAQFFSDLQDYGQLLEASPEEWPDIVDALIGNKAVRSTKGSHPRLAILGPIEARLQSFDRIVLGGLNEKTWPAQTQNDPFLSRPMKRALSLPPPERRTGLAAHDFQMLMGTKDVILSHALKLDNAPSITSRWIQRLHIIAGEQACQNMKNNGQRYLNWAHQIDSPKGAFDTGKQPRPTPPLDVRPNQLSITEIATWIKDPYAIYAKHILKLSALDPLSRQADSRERGTLYHGILEDFIKTINDPTVANAQAQLLAIAKKHFQAHTIPLEQKALWWPRFETIAKLFIEHLKQEHPAVLSYHPELYGKTDKDLDGFTLTGRADRIDRLKEGSIAIVDYKTGDKPKLKDVQEFIDPQLTLSAAMAERGAFGKDYAQPIEHLSYIRLKEKDVLHVDRIDNEPKKGQQSAEQLADDSFARLRALIKAYRNPDKEYRSKARLITDDDWPSDYDHLARVAEWSLNDDGEQD